MAHWNSKQAEREAMDRLIQQNPGISPAELARRLGVSRSTATQRLPGMEAERYPVIDSKPKTLVVGCHLILCPPDWANAYEYYQLWVVVALCRRYFCRHLQTTFVVADSVI